MSPCVSVEPIHIEQTLAYIMAHIRMCVCVLATYFIFHYNRIDNDRNIHFPTVLFLSLSL